MPHHRMGRGPCGLICWCITAVLCCSICQKDQENREAEAFRAGQASNAPYAPVGQTMAYGQPVAGQQQQYYQSTPVQQQPVASAPPAYQHTQ